MFFLRFDLGLKFFIFCLTSVVYAIVLTKLGPKHQNRLKILISEK
jgi:hypothetical protein